MDNNKMLDFIVTHKHLIRDYDLNKVYSDIYRRAFLEYSDICTYDKNQYVSINYHHNHNKPYLDINKTIPENTEILIAWLKKINVSIADFLKIQFHDHFLRHIYKSGTDFSKGSSFHLQGLVRFLIEEETGERQYNVDNAQKILDDNDLKYSSEQFRFKVYNTEIQGFKNGKLKISRFAQEIVRLKEIQANL